MPRPLTLWTEVILLSTGVSATLVALIKNLHKGCTVVYDLVAIMLDTVALQLLPQLQQLGGTIAYSLPTDNNNSNCLETFHLYAV